MFIVELALGGGPERVAARPDHGELLAALRDDGVVAGPFHDESGALLIFNVGSGRVRRPDARRSVLHDDGRQGHASSGADAARSMNRTVVCPGN
jgi:hypothetical protein